VPLSRLRAAGQGLLSGLAPRRPAIPSRRGMAPANECGQCLVDPPLVLAMSDRTSWQPHACPLRVIQLQQPRPSQPQPPASGKVLHGLSLTRGHACARAEVRRRDMKARDRPVPPARLLAARNAHQHAPYLNLRSATNGTRSKFAGGPCLIHCGIEQSGCLPGVGGSSRFHGDLAAPDRPIGILVREPHA
jgi:hypothetical protein